MSRLPVSLSGILHLSTLARVLPPHTVDGRGTRGTRLALLLYCGSTHLRLGLAGLARL